MIRPCNHAQRQFRHSIVTQEHASSCSTTASAKTRVQPCEIIPKFIVRHPEGLCELCFLRLRGMSKVEAQGTFARSTATSNTFYPAYLTLIPPHCSPLGRACCRRVMAIYYEHLRSPADAALVGIARSPLTNGTSLPLNSAMARLPAAIAHGAASDVRSNQTKMVGGRRRIGSPICNTRPPPSMLCWKSSASLIPTKPGT
jgi:hypothetical protein